MIEDVDDVNEPFATVQIQLYEVDDDHIPVMEVFFAEGYPIERSHIISIRDSVALLLYKMDMTIEISQNMEFRDE
jgi:hypothetical protein